MQSMLIVLLVLVGTLLQASHANDLLVDEDDYELRERRLLGGLLGGVLGGGKKEGEGGKKSGGLLGGLLGGGGGGGGLLGGLLGGKDGGLLGGLLGGKGGGLLGGLLGGKGGGLLGGLLGGKDGGLLGGLLGGKDGGLLGGLLGGGGLNKLLNAVFCLVEHLSLDVVLDLLNSLGVDKLLGLNEIACKEGGDSLLGVLFSKNGILPLGIIEEVLCLVKTIGLPSVNRVLDEVGLDALLGLHNITCADGNPLLEEGSTAAGLLEQLISYIGVDAVVEVGVETVLKLDRLLVKEGITDLKAFVQRIICLIKQIGLADVVDSIEAVGVAGIYRINDASCNGTSTVALDVKVKAEVRGVLPLLLKTLSLEAVIKLITDVGIVSLIRLSSFLAVNGTIEVAVLNKVVCITSSVGISVAINLLEKIGLTEFLILYGTICPSGKPLLFPTGTDPRFLVLLFANCVTGTVAECLNGLGQAFTNAADSVCPFCPLLKHNAIIQECKTVCRQ